MYSFFGGTDISENKERTFPNDRRFTKAHRLLKRYDFVLLSRRGAKIHSALFLANVMKGKSSRTRLGITVTKRIGSAVTRNRIKRQVREFFRQNQGIVPGALDINVIAKKGSDKADTAILRNGLSELFHKIKDREKSKPWPSQ